MEPLNPATDGASANIVEQNLAKLRELFPDAFTESSEDGEPRWKVDFDALREVLGDAIEEKPERYSFTWNGKSRATLIANTPTAATLRPCPKESINWDTTKNLFIEGDNLEVLKLLQKSYHRKVKMVYIDPPYNTGKEFIYPDRFQENLDTYLRYTGQTDEEGFKVSANSESSGRYHTNWLNMMLPRLKLSRHLLREDGAIVISIDDHEVSRLRMLTDAVFGEENFVACIANTNNPKGRSDDKHIATAHEYMLVYAKNIGSFSAGGFEPGEHILSRYNKSDPLLGRYREIDLRKTGDNDLREDRPNLFYYFVHDPETGKFYPTEDDEVPDGYVQIKPVRSDGKEGNWRWGLDTAKEQLSALMPKFMPNRQIWGVFEKDLLTGRDDVKATTSWSFKDVNSERGSEEFIALGFDKRVFPRPKPIGTIKRALQVCTSANGTDIVLDFFAGSCSSAQAVLDQNVEDSGDRRFIMVQLPEPCDDDSVALESGYKTIADIGKERIRRCTTRLAEERAERLDSALAPSDLGFRVFRLDSSNIELWDTEFDAIESTLLDSIDNIKTERSEADVLCELLLKFGLDLAEPIEERRIAGSTVFSIGAGALVVCLAKSIGLDVVEGIVALKKELKPEVMRVVFRDSGFKDDVVKANAVQILKQAGLADEQIRSL